MRTGPDWQRRTRRNSLGQDRDFGFREHPKGEFRVWPAREKEMSEKTTKKKKMKMKTQTQEKREKEGK
jgi:hypothetical protein